MYGGVLKTQNGALGTQAFSDHLRWTGSLKGMLASAIDNVEVSSSRFNR